VKNQKGYFGTFKWSPKQTVITFFALTHSQKSLSVYSAHTLTKTFTKKLNSFHQAQTLKLGIFYFSPKVAYGDFGVEK
jgi:hypothetical protein